MASVLIRVSDFVIIRGDTSRRIGDTNRIWEQNFRVPEQPTGFTITHSSFTTTIRWMWDRAWSDARQSAAWVSLRSNRCVGGIVHEPPDAPAAGVLSARIYSTAQAPSRPGPGRQITNGSRCRPGCHCMQGNYETVAILTTYGTS